MSLLKHSSFNLIGSVVPAFISIPALGYMARVLGVELFGIYTLAIAVVGYAGIFDGGMTRAVVREVALYRNDQKELKNIFSSSTFVIIILSFIAMCVLFLSANKIVFLLNISQVHKDEAEVSIKVLSMSIPFFLVSQVWLSMLEGREDFSGLNIQRTLGSIILAGFPVFILFFSQKLTSAMYGLFIARVIILFLSAHAVRKEIISARFMFNKKTIGRLVGYGQWITISNIVSPIMSYFDRFIAANVLGAQNIAYYTAPAELINKGLIVPASLTRAIFPKLISSNEAERVKLRQLGYILIIVICGIGAIVGGILSKSVMTIWMGQDFSGQPVLILNVLLIGYFFNSLAQLPFSNIQAYGKAKWTALVHLCELIPYLMLIFQMINHFGLIGVALAWTIRSFCDFIILSLLSNILNKRFSHEPI